MWIFQYTFIIRRLYIIVVEDFIVKDYLRNSHLTIIVTESFIWTNYALMVRDTSFKKVDKLITTHRFLFHVKNWRVEDHLDQRQCKINLFLNKCRWKAARISRRCQDRRNHNHSECLPRLQRSYIPWGTPFYLTIVGKLLVGTTLKHNWLILGFWDIRTDNITADDPHFICKV